jgi:hypothetical protein
MAAETVKRSFFLRIILPIAFVFVVCWVMVVLYWQSSQHEPTGSDIALYLIGLPLGMIVSYAVFKKSIDFTRQKVSGAAESKAVAASAAAQPSSGQDVAPTQDPALAFRIRLQSSAMRFSAGSDAAEVIASLMEPVSPDLHSSLKNSDGFPVFAAEVPDLDTSETLDLLQAYFEDDEDQKATVKRLPVEVLRSLTLADQVLEEALAATVPPVEPLRGSMSGATAAPSFLILHMLLPSHWQLEQRNLAGAWLQSRVEAFGWQSKYLQLNVMACRHDAEVLELVDALNIQVNRRPSLDQHLVLACDSYVGEEQLMRLENKRLLSSPKNPEGHIIGEGAVAVLLSSTSPMQSGAIDVHRLALGERSSPAGPGGGTSVALFKTLLDRAITVADVESSEIVYVLSDCDQRPSRAVELSSAVNQCLTELDISKQSFGVSAACGYSGAVAILAALAIAGVLAEEEQKPVLVATVLDPFKRGAVIVKPIVSAISDTSENNAA